MKVDLRAGVGVIVIVTPAPPGANNGNWRTASRWARMLAPRHRVRIVRAWPDAGASGHDAAMIALHARRSAASIEAWARAHPDRGLAVVLTGTDLYGAAAGMPVVRRSLASARRVVVLQERAMRALPAALRAKTGTIFQSTSARAPQAKARSRLRAIMVGHLREEKSPETLFAAARMLRGEGGILIDHAGEALEPRFAALARATQRDCPGYRWLGALDHERTRRRIQRAHVLVHASRVEGGAHVIAEAVRSGTPVLASRIDGNVGMLGASYPGYFRHGDAAALARLLVRCRDDAAFLDRLETECSRRARLFEPAAERASVLRLARELLRARR